MSFIPAGQTPTEFGFSADAQEREHELEAKAARYAQLHADGAEANERAGTVRRALGRIRVAIRRGR